MTQFYVLSDLALHLPFQKKFIEMKKRLFITGMLKQHLNIPYQETCIASMTNAIQRHHSDEKEVQFLGPLTLRTSLIRNMKTLVRYVYNRLYFVLSWVMSFIPFLKNVFHYDLLLCLFYFRF